MGKLGTEDLKRLLSCIRKDSRVPVPPMPGYDSGVHLIGDKYLVVSTDPCIGVPEDWFGWLLVHYAASDVALFGAKPEFGTINLLGPVSTKPRVFQTLMEQTCEAANGLDMAIVTGHTGTYQGLLTVVGVCTAYGTVDHDSLRTPGNARSGDYLYCVKPIGMETVVNFALTQRSLAEELFGLQETLELSKLVYVQSCVKEALLLAELEGVHAMHDAAEGGIVAALNEMAEASDVGFKISIGRLPIPKQVCMLQRYLRLSEEQILSMSSTGTILAAVSPEAKSKVERTLKRNKVEACLVGTLTYNMSRVMESEGKEKAFPSEADDPYARILSGEA